MRAGSESDWSQPSSKAIVLQKQKSRNFHQIRRGAKPQSPLRLDVASVPCMCAASPTAERLRRLGCCKNGNSALAGKVQRIWDFLAGEPASQKSGRGFQGSDRIESLHQVAGDRHVFIRNRNVGVSHSDHRLSKFRPQGR